MNNIKLLDTNTINKIAAGEVVERPASVIKELVENSIDAGATRIEVEIQNGGKALMRVTDDGCGMSKDDAALSIRRHATSKLSTVQDLQNISTLGFRGEAVPTIAAVSKFTLQTRRAEDELGTKIKIDGGKLIDNFETGCKIGTTVLVEELFFNTPARLKFLKTTATEANKIHDFIVKLSLSHPEISFKFVNGNRTALTTPGNGKIFDALTSIYGSDMTGALIETKFELEDVKLFGYISKPNFLKTYRNWQTFIINGRVISSRTISKAVDDAYRALIPRGGYPLAVFKIEVPQNTIDVNVHPQKTELRFEDEGKIFKVVYHAVKDAVTDAKEKVDSHDLKKVATAPDTFHYEPMNLNLPEKKGGKVESLKGGKIESKSEKNSADKNFSTDFDDDEILSSENFSTDFAEEDFETEFVEEKNSVAENVAEKIPAEKNFTDKLQPIGQVALCYIVAQSENDLYLIDQHAAHERILFDKLSSYAGSIPAQQLLIHRILHFDSRESLVVEKYLELFAELGFGMELAGQNEFRLMEIPADASDADAEEMMREIISSLPEDSNFADEERRADISRNIRQSVLAITACRAAIKAGQKLNEKQMQIILDDLSKTPNPYTCPHGRPTIIKFSADDLAKMFKRTGF